MERLLEKILQNGKFADNAIQEVDTKKTVGSKYR